MNRTVSTETPSFALATRLGALGLVLVLAACGRLDPQAEVEQTKAALDKGDLRTAAIHLSNVLQAEPDDVEGWILRGRLALAAGDPDSARTAYERAETLGAEPAAIGLPLADALVRLGQSDRALERLDGLPESLRNEEFWVLRGEALIGAGKLDEALAALRRSAETGGAESGRALIAEAEIARLRGQTKTAEDLLTRAVGASPDDPSVLTARGTFYLRTQRLEDAARDFQAAADRYAKGLASPQEVTVLASLVQVELTLNELDAAADAATRLTKRAPGTPAANYAAGLIAYRGGRFDQAANQAQRAVTAVPDNPRFLTLLGAAHLAMGHLGQAEQHFMDVLSRSPNDASAIQFLAETRLRQQRPEAALDALRRVTEEGSSPQIDSLQAAALLQNGDAAQASALLERAVARAPGDPALRLQLAQTYLAAGREDKATELLRGISGGDAELTANLMLLFAHVRSGDLEAGRAQAEELLARFPNEARAHAAVGVFYQLTGDRAKAQSAIEEAVRLDGRFVPGRLILAGLLAAAGRREEAERELQQVLALDPANTAALASLAQLNLGRGDRAGAADLLTRALSTSDTAPLHLALARVRLQQNDINAAEEQIEAARTLSPESPEVAAARGLLALAKGRPGDGVRFLRIAQTALPERPDIALALGEALAANGDLAGARETLRHAVEVTPGSVAVRAALGAAELGLGNADAALDVATALERDYPQQAAGYLLEADVLIAQRRYDAAAGRFDLAYQRSPDFDVLSRWVMALRLAGKPDAVEPPLSAWVKQNPADLPGRLLWADVLQGEGRNDEALDQYGRVLELDPENIVALNNAAWLYHEAGASQALDFAQRAARLAPENPAVLDTLGWILVQMNRPKDGIDPLQKAAGLAPEEPDIQYHVAQTQILLGQNEEGRKTLQALLATKRPFSERDAAEALLEKL
jgi:putative PEP-CTERM system TPR-repeat lipoprotein